MVNAPSVSLKVIVITHFVLSVWAAMIGRPFLDTSYIYMNAFILAFGVWAIINPESSESILMFMLLNLISIVMDIIFLAIFTPLGHNYYESGAAKSQANTYRFSLGMAIVNLIIKPFTSFVLYRLYQDRGGQYSDFGIPGMPGFGGGSSSHAGNYENIDQPVPTNTVETASPHSTIDKTGPYGPMP